MSSAPACAAGAFAGWGGAVITPESSGLAAPLLAADSPAEAAAGESGAGAPPSPAGAASGGGQATAASTFAGAAGESFAPD